MGQSRTKLVWDTYGHLIDATQAEREDRRPGSFGMPTVALRVSTGGEQRVVKIRVKGDTPPAPWSIWPRSFLFLRGWGGVAQPGSNRVASKTGGCYKTRMDIGDWQGRRDSNPQHPVLETGALPVRATPLRKVEAPSGRMATVSARQLASV